MRDLLSVTHAGRGMAIAVVKVKMKCAATTSRGQAVAVAAGAYTAVSDASQASVLQLRSSTCGIAMDNYATNEMGTFCIQGACQALVVSATSTALTADARLAFFGGRVLQLDASAVDTRRYVAISGDTGALTTTGVLKNVVMMGPNGLGISGGTA